jgi:hypothetical protein
MLTPVQAQYYAWANNKPLIKSTNLKRLERLIATLYRGIGVVTIVDLNNQVVATIDTGLVRPLEHHHILPNSMIISAAEGISDDAMIKASIKYSRRI